MKTVSILTLAVITSAALTGAAASQTMAEPTSIGPLAGAPQAMSVDTTSYGAAGRLGEGDVLVKEAGFATAAPIAPIASILGAAARGLDIDAMSIGIDWILANAKGEIEIPPGHWGALTFSVSRKTRGIHGPIRDEAKRGGEAAAGDLFSYVLPGSSGGMPIGWVGRPMRAQDSIEVDISPSGKTAGNIDAHDLFVPLYARAAGLMALLPKEPSFFFSVTTKTASRVPLSWGAGARSGAAIFEVKWSDKTKKWAAPRVRWLPDALGLKPTEELDALAVDSVRKRLLFSTKTATRDEILYFGFGFAAGAATPVPYTTQGGSKRVSSEVGAGQADDVDAICSVDPGGQATGNLHYFFGTTQRPLLPFPHRLSGSVFRGGNPNGDQLVICLTGWPPNAFRRPGKALLFVSTMKLNPVVQVAQRARNPRNRFGGDPVTITVPIPQRHTRAGTDLLWHWAATGQFAFVQIDLAHAVRIRL